MMTRRALFATLAAAPLVRVATATPPTGTRAHPLACPGRGPTPRTTPAMASALVKLIAADALPMLMDNLVMGNLVNRNYESFAAKGGDTVNVPIPLLTVHQMWKTGTMDEQARRVDARFGNAQIVLNKHMEANCIIDARVALADSAYRTMMLQPVMIALAESVETTLLAAGALLPMSGWPTPGARPRGMTERLVDLAETNLFYAYVPSGTSRFLVVSPEAYKELRQIPRFSEYTSKDGLARWPAQYRSPMGRLKDFYVFRSPHIAPLPLLGFTRHLAFARDALGLIIRRPPIGDGVDGSLDGTGKINGRGVIVEHEETGSIGVRVSMGYQPNTWVQTFTVDMLFGAGVLRDNYGVSVYS